MARTSGELQKLWHLLCTLRRRIRAARVKPAAHRRIRTVTDLSGKKFLPAILFLRIRNRKCLDQRMRIRMHRMTEDLLRLSDLHDFSKIHDCDPVTDIIDRAEPVSDKKQCQMQLLLQALQQIQDLRLN